ncbi:nucleoporin GLE1-like [Centruroides sculpturatus]|uniref:nucleoporin GLE1-like n=1 Tax=Centruroides sculpturatus TaxID=218467 RepID=UPI000C6DCA81|nr:nucleoporin GLE1-like [Centruroides sculpturatus]
MQNLENDLVLSSEESDEEEEDLEIEEDRQREYEKELKQIEKLEMYRKIRSVRIDVKERVEIRKLVHVLSAKLGKVGAIEQICFRPGNIAEITLTTMEDKEILIGEEIMIKEKKCLIESLEAELLNITLKYVPGEYNEFLIKKVMMNYGKVIKINPKYHPGEPKIKNGTFTVIIETKKRVPNFIEIFGKQIQTFYPGMKEQCRKCGSFEHKARECVIKTCHRCGESTHLIKDCIKCPKCLKEHKGECRKLTFSEIVKRGFPKTVKKINRKETDKKQENENTEQKENQMEIKTDTKQQQKENEEEQQEEEIKTIENTLTKLEEKNAEDKKEENNDEEEVQQEIIEDEKKQKEKLQEMTQEEREEGMEIERLSRKRTPPPPFPSPPSPPFLGLVTRIPPSLLLRLPPTTPLI